jgi:hypothetical protein
MFTLILHHPYRRVAEAIDISGADNHGLTRDVGLEADGQSPGSGALRFDAASSRAWVPTRPMFSRFHALKIEAVVRVQSLGVRRNIVEGHNSFAFFIHPDGSLLGTALTRVTPGGPLGWFGADSVQRPSGTPATVPTNTWVKLTYIHDGFAAIRLFINDTLVSVNNTLHSPIRPVGSLGLHIGNWPNADSYTFHGDIDDVRIWKWEPDAAYYNFFCRKTCGCWAHLFRGIGKAASGPEGHERLRSLLQCLGGVQTEIIRAVRRQDEGTLKAIEKLSRRYRELWCRGSIDGAEMRRVLEEWMRLLEHILGERLPGALRQMVACVDRHGLLGVQTCGVDLKTCDPAFAGFIQMLTELLPKEVKNHGLDAR